MLCLLLHLENIVRPSTHRNPGNTLGVTQFLSISTPSHLQFTTFNTMLLQVVISVARVITITFKKLSISFKVFTTAALPLNRWSSRSRYPAPSLQWHWRSAPLPGKNSKLFNMNVILILSQGLHRVSKG